MLDDLSVRGISFSQGRRKLFLYRRIFQSERERRVNLEFFVIARRGITLIPDSRVAAKKERGENPSYSTREVRGERKKKFVSHVSFVRFSEYTGEKWSIKRPRRKFSRIERDESRGIEDCIGPCRV